MFANSWGHAGRIALAAICVLPSAHAQSEFQSSRFDLLAALDPVVVTASKYEDDSLKVPAFVTYITRAQIESSGVRTVNEAVIRLAGVPGRPSLAGGSEYSLDLVGFGDTFSSNMVIAIDGIPLKEGDSAEPRLSSIPIEQVERIEIQRGGASVLYGENAVAGVINVITRASSTDFSPKQSAELFTGLGSFGTREVSGSGYYSANGLRISLAGFARDSQGYRRHSGSDNQALTLDTQYQLDRSRTGLSIHVDRLRAELPGPLTLDEFKADPKQSGDRFYEPGKKYGDENIQSNVTRVGGFYEIDAAGFNFKLTGNRRAKDVKFTRISKIPNHLETVNNYFDLITKKLFNIGTNKSTLLLGGEINHWKQDRDNQFGQYQYAAKAYAFYIKNDVDIISSQLRLSTGLRSETIQRMIDYSSKSLAKSQKLTAWDLGISKRIGDQYSVYARAARNYRLPNVDDARYNYTCQKGCNTPTDFSDDEYSFDGISLINAQISVDHELGWKFISPQGGRAGFRLFQSNLSNEIAYDPFLANVNLDRTYRRGMDLDAVYFLHPELRISFFASLKSSRFDKGPNKGKEIPMAPRQVSTIYADWNISSRQLLGLGWHYVGGQFASTDYQNKTRLPSYDTTSLRYIYRYEGSEFAVTVRNLFDTPYYSYGTTSQGYLAVYPDPGRSITASLKVNF